MLVRKIKTGGTLMSQSRLSNVSVISSDPPCKEWNARFITVPLKPLCVRRVQRYVCVNLLNPAYVQLNFPVCAAYITNSTQKRTVVHQGTVVQQGGTVVQQGGTVL